MKMRKNHDQYAKIIKFCKILEKVKKRKSMEFWQLPKDKRISWHCVKLIKNSEKFIFYKNHHFWSPGWAIEKIAIFSFRCCHNVLFFSTLFRFNLRTFFILLAQRWMKILIFSTCFTNVEKDILVNFWYW